MIENTDTFSGPYLANGSVVDFPVTFPFFAPSEIAVWLADSAGTATLLELTADYTVTGDPGEDDEPTYVENSKITTVATYASGYSITILRNIPLTQPANFVNQGTFYPLVVEGEYDRIVMQLQMLAERIGRASLSAVGSPPTTTAQANTYDYRISKTMFGDAQAGSLVFGAHVVPGALKVLEMELEAFGGAPAGSSLICKLVIAGVLNSQAFTLGAGLTYARTLLAMDSQIAVASGAKIEWVFTQVGASAPGFNIVSTVRLKG